MIQIKNPCDANWQEMSPASSGKYCGTCEKVVVDFSKMNDVQIKEYFTEYTEQKTCGRFLTSQVDRKLKMLPKNYLYLFFSKISRASIIQLVIFLMTGSFIWLGSCVKKQNPATNKQPKYIEPNTHNRLIGDTIFFDSIDTFALQQEDTLPHLTGEITIYKEMQMGKVRMIDTISQRIKRRK